MADKLNEGGSPPNLLVYGLEQVGVKQPAQTISTTLFKINFEPFDTDKKFHDYNGVILFQSTFENIKLHEDFYGSSDYDVECKSAELLRRRTQLNRLLENGGWICFLLHRDFIDSSKYGDFTNTDLCKIALNYPSFYRKWFRQAHPVDHFSRAEFKAFLEEYGASSTYFDNYNEYLLKNMKVLCKTDDHVTGFVLFNSAYFVPTRLPKGPEVQDFFTKLGTSLVSTAKKLKRDIPAWVEEYRFPSELSLRVKEAELQTHLVDVRTQLNDYIALKGALCFEGDSLVESVKAVLRNGLGLKLSDKQDQYLEDATILDDAGGESILVEIKGMNENLKNPNIYQADSHRGRREKPPQFPSILIANTFIKSSNKIDDKLREFGSEQIKLAAEKHVLIIRTIDLLNLIQLKERGDLTSEKIANLLKEEIGWLKVLDDTYKIIKE